MIFLCAAGWDWNQPTCQKSTQEYGSLPLLILENIGLKEKSACDRGESLIGLKPVRGFFPHSNLCQTNVVNAQNESQRAFHEIFSKLVSTFSVTLPARVRNKPPLPEHLRHAGGPWFYGIPIGCKRGSIMLVFDRLTIV